ncbi:MAG: endonuclease, partial [Thermoanaerobaculia bacterium]|nr:endonuclease [Thermoanaerobaculia bacterium]
ARYASRVGFYLDPTPALRPASAAVLLGLFLALRPAGAGLADPPPGYYDPVDASSAATLRATLHPVLHGHTRFPYSASTTDTWDILELADQDPGNSANILDVYRNASIEKFGGGAGPYNREHTWPNSYGFPDDGPTNYPYTDTHALFLSNVDYNGARGNAPFGACDGSCIEWETAGGTLGLFPGTSNWSGGGVWETWIGRRGDVARAQFYLDVRYAGGTHPITGAAEPDLILTDDEGLIQATGSNAAIAHHGLLAVLLQWHRDDPVDAKERARNDVVAGYQGNRNPFIDHPEWAPCLFSNACGIPSYLFSDDFEFATLIRWSERAP